MKRKELYKTMSAPDSRNFLKLTRFDSSGGGGDDDDGDGDDSGDGDASGGDDAYDDERAIPRRFLEVSERQAAVEATTPSGSSWLI